MCLGGNLQQTKRDNQEVTEKIEKLQLKIAQLEAEKIKNPQIEDLKSKLALKESEKENLLNMFNEMTHQFQFQSEELNEESNFRTILINSIHRLSEINQYISNKYEDMERKYKEQQEKDNTTKNHNVSESSPINYIEDTKEIEHDMLQLIPTNMIDDVRNVFDDEKLTLHERIIQIITLLVSNMEHTGEITAENNFDMTDENEKLLALVSSNYQFIKDIIESKSKASWILKPLSFESARNNLICQSARIDTFLSENHIELKDKSGFFECLMIDTNDVDFTNTLSSYLDNFESPKTSEGKILFAVLLQAVLANDALRKFAIEARNQVAQQLFEIKSLKTEIESLNSEMNVHAEDENFELTALVEAQKKEIAELKAKIDKTKKVLRRALTDGDDSSAILEAIDEVGPCDDKRESEMISMIEEKSEEAANLQEENSQLKHQLEQLNLDISQLRKQSEDVTKEQLDVIQKIESDLQMSEDKLKETTEKLTSEITKLRTENELLRAEKNSDGEALTKELDGLKSDAVKAIKMLKKENRLLKKSCEETLQKATALKNADKAKIKALKQVLKAEKEAKEQLEAEANQSIECLKNQGVKLEESLNTASECITKLQTELVSTKTQLNNTIIENKMLSTRLAGKDEKAARERSVLESQMRLRILATETDCQSRIDNIKSELETASKAFFNNVIEALGPLVDGNMTEDAILKIVKKGADSITKYDSVITSLNESRSDLASIRRILGILRNAKLVDGVQEYANNASAKEEQIKELNNRIKSMKREVIEARSIRQLDLNNKEWEEWARKMKVIAYDGFGAAGSAKEVRFAIEEVIFGALGNRIVWRRLDSLRAQKRLILGGASTVLPKQEQSLLPLIHIGVFVRKMQRLSGHIQTGMGLDRPQQANYEMEKKPLFTRFVVGNDRL